jgi:hypothetical protein
VVHVSRLGLIRHEEVTVIVVPDVFLIEPRDVQVALERVRLAHVPARDELHAVRVRVHGENDDVVQDASRLLVVAAHEIVDGGNELVRAEDFGRVQPAVDPHDRLPLARQRARFLRRHRLGECEPARDLTQPLQAREIGG